MKRTAVSFFLLICSLSAFSQKMTHNISIEAGCSVLDEAIGPQLEARYIMGVIKYLDVTASISSCNGFHYDKSSEKNHYSANCYSMSVGVGSHVDFLKLCRLRLLAEGGITMQTKNNVMYLRPSFGVVAGLSFKLNPYMELGLCCGKSWVVAHNGSVEGSSGILGIVWGTDIGRRNKSDRAD